MFRETRASYKPFEYEWADELFMIQQKSHWLPEEVSMASDIRDWKTKLTESEKNLLTQTQLYLANADTDVASCYVDKYLPALPLPEVRGMLLGFAAIEQIHCRSYAYTIDSLGMPESSYSAFLEIPELWEKHVWITRERAEPLSDVQKFLLDIVVCSAFGEGLQLYSAFVILLSFQRRGLMNGLGTLTSFIFRDEDLHCFSMIQVFKAILEKYPEALNKDLVDFIGSSAAEAVRLEDHFLDLAFAQGDVVNLTKDQLKQYIRYVADKRLSDLGLLPMYFVKENPVDWVDDIVGPEHTNFFECRPTAYSKINLSGDWETTWSECNAEKYTKEVSV